MRIEIAENKIYTFIEASRELKDKIIESFDDGMIYENSMAERICTLNVLAEILVADLDWSLSCVPDRGEFIKITPKYAELNFEALSDIIEEGQDCPFTGVCYDHDILDHLNKDNLTINRVNFALEEFISSIHKEYSAMLSDEYIGEMCEANEYEFYETGLLA